MKRQLKNLITMQSDNYLQEKAIQIQDFLRDIRMSALHQK